MQEVEKRKMRDRVEAESRRRSFVGEGKDGQDKTVILGHVCECGGEIGPNTTLLKCVGCQGMIVGRLDPQLAIAREIALTNTALAWT